MSTSSTRPMLIDPGQRDAHIARLKRELGIERQLRAVELLLASTTLECIALAGIPYAQVARYVNDLGAWFGLSEEGGFTGSFGMGLMEDHLVLRVVANSEPMRGTRSIRAGMSGLLSAVGAHIGSPDHGWRGSGWEEMNPEHAANFIARLLASVPPNERG